MTIKSILCIFGGSQKELNAVNAAFILGQRYGAQIRFLHISPERATYAAAYSYGEAYACASLIDACKKENQERCGQARQHVEALAARHRVPLDASGGPAGGVSARFEHLTGFLDRMIAREGRLSDLIIVGRGTDAPNALHDAAAVAALFNTGRPVLLMPIAKNGAAMQWESKAVAVAWDGGLQSARAVFDAQPLIENAAALHVLTLREHGKVFDLEAGQGIMEYLCAHGFHPNMVVADRGHHAVGEVLLAQARELNADLLVMGAYGHSRMREMILGGVTEYMLQNADIPLLLSH